MLSTPYQQLNEVLDELISRLEHILNDYFIGAYLQGSFAVGEFDEHSDADFIVVLEEEIYEVLMSWGQQILDDPSPWSNRFYQGFIVLNYCRMLHDLRRGYPGSKREGAEWAKRELDPSWSGLIEDAWGSRPDPASKVKEPADAEAYEMTLRFVEYVMNESKRFMAE